MREIPTDLHEVDLSKPVRVHYNFHKKCLSVSQGGKVKAHLPSIALKTVRFQVSRTGRERVLREKRKNVHAFVHGYVTDSSDCFGISVKYNPYDRPYFYRRDNGQPVWESLSAVLIGSHIVI